MKDIDKKLKFVMDGHENSGDPFHVINDSLLVLGGDVSLGFTPEGLEGLELIDLNPPEHQ